MAGRIGHLGLKVCDESSACSCIYMLFSSVKLPRFWKKQLSEPHRSILVWVSFRISAPNLNILSCKDINIDLFLLATCHIVALHAPLHQQHSKTSICLWTWTWGFEKSVVFKGLGSPPSPAGVPGSCPSTWLGSLLCFLRQCCPFLTSSDITQHIPT